MVFLVRECTWVDGKKFASLAILSCSGEKYQCIPENFFVLGDFKFVLEL